MTRGLSATVKLGPGGRIVIPAEMRRRLGVDVGGELVMSFEDDCATLATPRALRLRACQRVARYISPDVSLSEELMKERKEEFEREDRQ